MNIAPQGMNPFTALACAAIIGFAAPRGSEAQTQAQAQAQAQVQTQTQTPPSAPGASAAHSNAQADAGEPRAATSPDAASAPAGAPEQSVRSNEPPARPEAPAAERRSQTVRADGKAEGKVDAKTAGKAGGVGKSAAVDRLELQTATVTGDREQPKVMYIVPWKRSDIGDLSGKPMGSLLDEALAPVDRDEFKREVMYYQAVRADASQNGAAAAGAATRAPPR